MIAVILPLRAFAYQSLFLVIAIAIESIVLYDQLNKAALKTIPPDPTISPKQSIYYATTTHLFTTVVGWMAFFLFFNTAGLLPSEIRLELLNFILFDRWTDDVAVLLILVSFITFFASLAIKQLGLMGLRWLLQEQPASPTPVAAADEQPSEPSSITQTGVLRDLRRETRPIQPQFNALLIANAWAYTAILAILFLRLLLVSNL